MVLQSLQLLLFFLQFLDDPGEVLVRAFVVEVGVEFLAKKELLHVVQI